ncbi:integral membrane sensor signal transduction histidine kinase [Salinisphaera sp. PC39]|uniref:sensor histidine kinase n=1 Tax=Salinisphaera sp. PC39 TaxID=1304156 RepID=UPI00333E43A9
MRVKPILVGAAALLAVAGFGFLVVAIQALEQGNESEVRAELRTFDRLGAHFNEELARARLYVDVQQDDLLRHIERMRELASRLGDGDTPLRGLDPRVDAALDAYLASLREKIDLATEYESRNLALINALELIPWESDRILEALPDENRGTRSLVLALNKEVLTYGILPRPDNLGRVEDLLYELSHVPPDLPAEVQNPLVKLSSLGNAVLIQKPWVQTNMETLLAHPVGGKLSDLQSAYNGYRAERLALAGQYRWLLVGYAAALLLGLGWLGWRLRDSYRSLDLANTRLHEANRDLEEKVAERTRHLEDTLAELKTSQTQLIQSEKMASLGQMVAGVSHEINTPLGYVRSNNDIVAESLDELDALLRSYRDTLAMLNRPDADLDEAARAMQELETLQREVDPDGVWDELRQLLADNRHGLAQISELVGDLKDFSRLDRSRTEYTDLNAGLDAALKICRNVLKDRIEVVRRYGELPQVECAPSQINQVFLNLITNAAQAIEGEGRIVLTTRRDGDRVVVRIRDTGSGMDEETRSRIFDPFYTTKPVGEGTGLGLAICYRIVNEHDGRIVVASAPGKGTEFAIVLPLRQPDERDSAAAAATAEA